MITVCYNCIETGHCPGEQAGIMNTYFILRILGL